MRAADGLGLMLGALAGHRSRSLMLLLAMAIGVVAVNLLTGLATRDLTLGDAEAIGRLPSV
ncbi:MAG TPA: ABC transporter permease, partial [Pseudomonas sp.]|nr:ABC transporter permease [Pseudomonas sp.]